MHSPKIYFGKLCVLTLLCAASVWAQSKNLADDQPSPKINPRLTGHSRKMEQRVYKVTDNVYSAVGFGLANSTMIVGNDGIIIVDVMESDGAAKNVLAEFRKITDKPVKAVVYTHNHSDHTMGVKVFASEDDVKAGKVNIYAHETMMDTVINNASVVAPILGLRSTYTFGILLERGSEGWVNQGIGPAYARSATSFIAPTKTFKDKLDLTIAGVKLQFIYAPSETDDEIVVWLPEQKLLQSAEVIQGETFPNVHTLRGTKYRDPVAWYKTIDMLRSLRADHIVPSHGRPISGAGKVEEMLTAYRDAIQYVHDQTIRWMNKGLTPDEIVEQVAHLPAHLANHPWLGEFYGTVKHSVRQIYVGYLGWFEADPTALDPLPRTEESKRYVELMGGREAVFKAAKKALDAGEHQWTAELLTHLIRVNNNDTEARKLKAEALRQLAYKTANINWRNWYISAAKELDGTLSTVAAAAVMSSLAAPDILKALPVSKFFESMTVRLDPVKSADAHLTAAFRFTDTGKVYAVEVRRGIAQVHESLPSKVDIMLNVTTASLHRVMARQTTFVEMLQKGEIKAEGEVAVLERFNSFFDPPATNAPLLTVR